MKKIPKQYLQIIIILVVGLWVGCIVFAVSASIAKKKYAPAPTTTAPYDITTYSPATTTDAVPTESTEKETEATEAPVSETEETEEPTTEKPSTLSVPKTKNEIVDAYIMAVNNLKSSDNFTLAIMESLEVKIDEITGGTTAKALVQRLIDQNASKTPENHKFVNGMDAGGLSPNQVIAPRNIDASLSASDVVSATAEKMTDTAYKLKINLGKSLQTLETPASGYSKVVNVLSTETLDLPSSISISEMNVTYNNSVIEATIDDEGRILTMKHYVEVPSAEIIGKITLAAVSLKIHGNFTGTYTVTY